MSILKHFKTIVTSLLVLFIISNNLNYIQAQDIVSNGDIPESCSYISDYFNDVKSKKMNLTYELFGAKGDGRTNDFFAIRSAHNCANDLYLQGYPLTVQATKDKTYLISSNNDGSKKNLSIDVITDVNWNNANFIIDDSNPYDNNNTNKTFTDVPVFKVVNPMKVYTGSTIYSETNNSGVGNFTIPSSTQNLKSLIDYIDNKLKSQNKKYNFFNASQVWMIQIQDSTSKIFKRTSSGNGGSSGVSKSDIILVDKSSGEVLSPIDWQYDVITNITAWPIPDNPITIQNGYFTSIVNPNLTIYANSSTATNPKTVNYNYRNINIESTGNVNLKNIYHYIDNEEDKNAYYGFINISKSAYINMDNVQFTPHRYFKANDKYDDGTSRTAPLGTYDLIFDNSINLHFNKLSYSCNVKKADGSIDYNTCYKNKMINSDVWGVSASNQTKNVFIKDSRLNRIDAHRGVTNLLIEGSNTTNDCVIGDKGLTLIGKGRVLIKNCKFDRSQRVINLRSDYGSSFDGFIFIDNIEWYLPNSTVNFIYSDNNGGHDYGYTSVFPQFYVNNVKINKADYNKTSMILLRLNEAVKTGSDAVSKYKFKGNSNFVNINSPVDTYLFYNSFVNNQNNLNIENYGNDKQISLVYTKETGTDIIDNLAKLNKTSTQFKFVKNDNALTNYNTQKEVNDRFFNNLKNNSYIKSSIADNVALQDLTASNGKINEDISGSRTKCSIDIPSDVDSLTIKFKGNSESILPEVIKEIKNLNYGENTVNFSIVGYKTRKDYTLTITRANPLQEVNIPSCNLNLIYNESPQQLINNSSEYTLVNNSQTDAGSYRVIARLNDGYIWSDKTSQDKIINCTIDKADPIINIEKQSIEGTIGDLIDNMISSSVKGSFTVESSSDILTIYNNHKTETDNIKPEFFLKNKGEGMIDISFVPDNINYNSFNFQLPFSIAEKEDKQVINIISKTPGEIVYDNEIHNISGLESDTFYVEGKKYRIENITSTTGDIKDVGTYFNKIEGEPIIIDDETSQDVTDQFTINFINSQVKIIPLEISLIQDDKEVEYNGDMLINDNPLNLQGALINEYDVYIDYSPSSGIDQGIYDNGEYNLNSLIVRDKNGEDITNNILLNKVKLGKLIIKNKSKEKIDITIEANSYRGIYDGKNHEVNGFKQLDFTVDNHNYYVQGVESFYEGKDVQDSIYEIPVKGEPIVLDENGNDVTEEFNINIIQGEFIIDKKMLILESGSAEKVEDGKYLRNEDVENKLDNGLINEDGYIEGEGATYIFESEIDYVGEISNEFTIIPQDNTNLENYQIEIKYGQLVIYEGEEIIEDDTESATKKNDEDKPNESEQQDETDKQNENTNNDNNNDNKNNDTDKNNEDGGTTKYVPEEKNDVDNKVVDNKQTQKQYQNNVNQVKVVNTSAR